MLPGLVHGTLAQHHRNISCALLARSSGQFVHIFEGLSLRPTLVGEAGAVREQLFERDFAVRGIHLRCQVRKDLLQRCAPRELPFLDQCGQHGRGHGLSVGAEMELIVDGDGRVGAVLTHADGSDRGQAFAGDNGSGERGEIVLLEKWCEQRVQIFGSWPVCESEAVGVRAKARSTMPRPHTPMLAIVMADRFVSRFKRSFLRPLLLA